MEKLASVPYFFCDDDCLAEILLCYARLTESRKHELLEMARKLAVEVRD